MSKLKALTDQLGAVKEKASAEGQDAIKGEFAEIFAADPLLESVTWEQYAPYFNDGDACVFRVHDFCSAQYNGEEVEEPAYSGDSIPKPIAKLLLDLQDSLNGSMEPYMADIFGDDVRITAHRDGRFDIDDCDHD